MNVATTAMSQTFSLQKFWWITFCCALVLLPGISHAQADTLSRARETRVRLGMPNFFAKLKAGKPVTIAFLGGSITQTDKGYCDQSVAWLQARYPASVMKTVNAGIGGTGSDFGAFRLGSQVLAHQPDLVFVEFAVNDQKKDPGLIQEAMEGIVRQIRRHSAFTDICFVYTLTGDMAPTLQQGQLPPSARAMEAVAQHYGIPTVHMGLEAVALAAAGKLVFMGPKAGPPGKLVFSSDNVHPYVETGHRLYSEALARAYLRIAQKRPKKRAHSLPKPLMAGNWEQATMVSAAGLTRQGNWQVLAPGEGLIKHLMPYPLAYVVRTGTPGAALTFTFEGTMFGLNDVMGPDTGVYEILIDGQPIAPVNRFDKHSTYYRASFFLSPKLSPGRHAVEIRLSGQALDKQALLLEVCFLTALK
jgi:lysophospholipase L1-like esterase